MNYPSVISKYERWAHTHTSDFLKEITYVTQLKFKLRLSQELFDVQDSLEQ